MGIPPLAALEIGTTRTVALIGECDADKRITVVGIGTAQTTGVRKGQINDLSMARYSIESAVRAAEKAADIDVRQTLMAVTGEHIVAEQYSGKTRIQSRDGVVTADDVGEVTDLARAKPLPSERHTLHTLMQTFTVDDQTGIHKPEGLKGSTIDLDMLVIHALKNRTENAVNAVRGAHFDVTDVAFAGICAAMAVLTPDQKRNGVVVIDLGGGTTDYVAYANNAIVMAGSLAVGGDHITNDIAMAFNIPQSRAEDLKIRLGSALVRPEDAGRREILPREVSAQERSISIKALQTIINARIDETLKIVRDRLSESDILPNLGAGVVFTGGGAYLRDLTMLAQRNFGLPCSIGIPANVSWTSEVPQPAALATTAGLLIYGAKMYETGSPRLPMLDFLKGLFGR